MLENIDSIINGNKSALDKDKAFTFIEFIKAFGFDNNPDSFFILYKEYLNTWADVKSVEDLNKTKEEYVRERMADTLKSITLNYSSYEEQDFIAHIDWSNETQIASLIPIYVRKIIQICEFYRKKRSEAPLIIRKHNTKGSIKSIEQIVYDKIVDFVFDNRNLLPQYVNIRRDLNVSIENFIDTYSDYFDIPRDTEDDEDLEYNDLSNLVSASDTISNSDKNNSNNTDTDNSNTGGNNSNNTDIDNSNIDDNKNRQLYFKNTNMNDVDYKDYLKIADAVNDILYSGDVYLNDIPLIASVGLNFADECMGDLLDVKNELLSDAVKNLVPLSEQVDLRRRLYEKYLGCDLYYIYADKNLDTYTDILCRADNPSGNLLNCGNADTASIESALLKNVYDDDSDVLKLASHIGLYFKPDKLGVLKIDAKSYTWEIDKDALSPETVYVFPDPWHYGDIGTNKSKDYPLLMTFKLDYDIKNFTSGEAKDDPILMLGSPGWHSYYSKQDDIFVLDDNNNYDYAFTSLANSGYLHSYQTDIYGNQFGLLKGVESITDEGDYIKVVVDDKIGFSDFNYVKEKNNVEEEKEVKTRYFNFNGGYFVNPTYKRKMPFNFNTYNYFDENYKWSGIMLGKKPLIIPGSIEKYLKCAKFSTYRSIQHKDNFRRSSKQIKNITHFDNIINNLVYTLFSHEYSNKEIKVIKKHKSAEELDAATGVLFVRDCSSNKNKPCKIEELLTWLKDDPLNIWNVAVEDIGGLENVISFDIMNGVISIETDTAIIYIPYQYNGVFSYDKTIAKPIVINKIDKSNFTNLNIVTTKRLFDEKTGCQYILQMRKLEIDEKKYLLPFVYKFNPKTYEINEVVDIFDILTEESYSENENTAKLQLQENYYRIVKKQIIVDIDDKIFALNNFIDSYGKTFATIFLSSNYNFENFDYNDCDINEDESSFIFTKNSALERFLICYIGYDSTDMPYLFEHKFKLLNNTVLNGSIITNVYSMNKLKDNNGNDIERVYIYADNDLENNRFFEKVKD